MGGKNVENPFLYDVEDLFEGEEFTRNLISVNAEVPKEILNLIAPDFAIRFEIVPVAIDRYGTLYFVTTKENFQPINLFTTLNVENFLSDLLKCNCRFLITDKQNIQSALNKYYNFSEENLRRALIKFYDFDKITFNSFEEITTWTKKSGNNADSKVLKKSLVEPPVSLGVEKVLNFVPTNIAVKFSLIPVQLSGDVLLLVTSSSRTYDEVQTISKMLKVPCRIFLTLDENIRAALKKFYHLDGLSKRTDFDFFTDGTFVGYKFLDREIAEDILQIVPFDMAINFSIVPLDFDYDGKLVLVTSSLNSVQKKNTISRLVHYDCKILMTDVDTFADILESAYHLSEILPEPDGDWANLRWKFLLAYHPDILLDKKNSGNYKNYFENFQAGSVDKLNLMVERQLKRENISPDDTGLVENVRAQCREILIAEICEL